MSLKGVRVLDFCWVGAGAFVTRILSDLGAEVIKVESRSHPDNLRLSGPHAPGAAPLEGSGYFATRNTGKKSLALNMQKPEALQIAARLAEKAALVTNNFRPGIMERWGLDYATLSAVNPSLVFLSMPMQGKSGPHADFVGFGSTIAALCGLVEMSGLPGRPPLGTGTHYPDHVPNPGHALVAVLAALWHRRRTGEGQEIELAQIESTINLLGPQIMARSAGLPLPAVAGNHKPGSVPRGVYAGTGEHGWIALEVETDMQWRALAAELGRQDWLGDAQLATVAGRTARQDEIDLDLAHLLVRQDVDDMVARLLAHGVPAARVAHADEVLADPRLAGRKYWHELPHREMKMLVTNTPPFKVVGEERVSPRTAPLIGEHTIEIVQELLGMPEQEARRLIEEKVFY